MYAKTFSAVAFTTLLLFSEVLLGQDPPIPESKQSSIVLVKLSAPAYPALARQTGIAGEVKLLLKIRSDGGIGDVEVVSGHPLLTQAALDSAKASQFDCSRCSAEVNPYLMIYTFEMRFEGDPCAPAPTSLATVEPFPRVLQSQNHITVVDRSICECVLSVTVTKVRSIKCLYLWHCSVRKTL